MARGGKRDGAGRKAGSVTTRTREAANRAAEEGLTPLDYMLTMLRDESLEPSARFEAAKAAAPYVHARLAAVEHSGGIAFSHEDALAELDDEPEGTGDPSEAQG